MNRNPIDNNQIEVLAPGPVNLHPDVLRALALPMIHHRTPAFEQIFRKVLQQLQWIFQTQQHVFISSCTGSGGMEALLVNSIISGDEVLVVDSGKFGQRWVEMAQSFGARVHVISVPWGQAVQVDQIQYAIENHPQIRFLLIQACETSTGVLHPIESIGRWIKKRNSETREESMDKIFFVVDGITALGALPLPMDEWGIDALVGGSQKAFMLPTGLAFYSFSKTLWDLRVENSPTPRFYFDARKELKANLKGETFFSSNVTLIRALNLVLENIQAQGMERHFQIIHRRAEMTRIFSKKLGFTLYPKKEEYYSPTVTALSLRSDWNGEKIRDHLEQKYNITIMGGQDQAKGKILRIGHMGYIDDSLLIRTLLGLYQSIEDLYPSTPFFIKKRDFEDQMRHWLTEH